MIPMRNLSIIVPTYGCALFLALAPLLAHGHAPEPNEADDAQPTEGGGETTEFVPVSIVVDVSALDLSPTWQDSTRNPVVFRMSEALTGEHGIEVVPPQEASEVGAAILRVELRWVDQADSHYEVSLELERGTEVTTFDTFECEGCLGHDLGKAITPRLGRVVPFLVIAPAEGSEGGTPPVGPKGPGGPNGSDDGRKKRPLGKLGKAGIATMAVGLGGAIGGAVMLGLGVRENHELSGSTTDALDLGPPGVIALVGGSVVLAAGAIMLGVDRHRAGKPRATALPLLGPRTAGCAFSIRF